ncbi:MAG: hormogonium polysaccharide biosynthesis protein HpsL [Pleurocapsa sp.]
MAISKYSPITAMVRAKSRKTKKSRKKNSQSNLSLKERLLKRRKAREERKKIITLVASCLIIGLVIGLPLAAVDIKLALGAIIIIPSVVVSYCYPRLALWFFLIYLPFSGTITYWLGEGNILFQLSKDIFYFPALIALIQECRRNRQTIIIDRRLIVTLAILVTLSLITLVSVNGYEEVALPYCDSLSEYDKLLRAPDGSLILNPETGIVYRTPCKQGSPLMQGIIGWKVFLGYIPLAFCSYYLIESKKQLVWLGRLLVLLAVICCVLGIIQYSLLASGICAGTRDASGQDLFRASVESKCFVGGSLLYSPSQGQIRLPGTFVSPWHWAWFLIANSFICFTVAFSDTSWLWRTTGLAGLVLVFVNSVICGQRIALALVPAAVIILLILTGQIANLKRFIPLGLVLALILTGLAINNPDIFTERVDSFVDRWNTAPPQAFIEKQFQHVINNQKGFFGQGLGKATNSARAFGSTVLIETYHPKVMAEVGMIGLLALVAFMTNLLVVTFQNYRSVKTLSIRSFGASFWVFILVITYFPYWYPLDTDPVAVYYWFFAGILLKLPSIDRQEIKQAKLDATKDNKTNNKGKYGKNINSRRKYRGRFLPIS